MKCPVCDNIHTSMVCPKCGFDSSKDYGKYPTLGPVGRVPAASALRQARAPKPPEKPPVPPTPEPAPPPRRKKPWLTVIACAVMLVLGIGIGAGLGGGKPEPSEPKETVHLQKPPETTLPPESTVPPETDTVIEVSVLENAYGSEAWALVAKAFTAETGIEVRLTADRDLEELLEDSMNGGEWPDVVYLSTGRPDGLTEQLVADHGLHPLTNALSLTVPGEDTKLSDKIIGGFTDNRITAPYGDGVTYLAPMFYSPTGLFYNASLFAEKGWTVPTTWDEMFILGDLAAAEGIALFTYPTVGYYDIFLFALMNAIGGPEFYNAVTTYEEGAWDSFEGQKLLSYLDALADYTHSSTPGQANNYDFDKNQEMAMDGRALFMPNGSWIISEMADYAVALENFSWGMTAVPDADAGSYAFCWFDQAWIPAGAEHISGAEQFIAFLYSDIAAEIFASAGAMQPIHGLSDMLEGENALVYSIYDNGASAVVGGFAPFSEIPGVTVMSTFCEPINALVSGTITIDDYAELVKTNSALMREKLLN